MSSLLVIGASSFTGKRFCEYARDKKADVAEVSLRNMRAVIAALDKAPEYIVNFAALNVVAPSWQYPSDYLYTNVYALTGIIDYLKGKPLKRFVQVSTPEVYGSTAGWVKEDAPHNPSTPYAVTRSAAEMMLRCYRERYNMPITITRGCNVYGAGQQQWRLIPKLIASIKRGQMFPLEGGGISARAFLHVEDMCAGIWTAMMADPSEYHISSRELQQIYAIAAHVCTKMGVRPKDILQDEPERPGKDAAYMLDSGRLRALGWEDKVSMDHGLDTCIAYMNDHWAELQKPVAYEHKP